MQDETAVTISFHGTITPRGRVWGVVRTVATTEEGVKFQILAKGITPLPEAANDRRR